ncbi:hypothetical protein L596_015235 [Steinernema carpocapsae]|uniref:Uncharacterized protein n=1 Tax=Steinernema carpocapsae TaxID=34508 RepID=A0A4U5NF89_STECR|nr:hypothetical protein L596_015235 [Steinernema carpocapsae]
MKRIQKKVLFVFWFSCYGCFPCLRDRSDSRRLFGWSDMYLTRKVLLTFGNILLSVRACSSHLIFLLSINVQNGYSFGI